MTVLCTFSINGSLPLLKSHFPLPLQVSGQRAGVGVIGIIECNFLKPAHNKQDFEYTKEYRYNTHSKRAKSDTRVVLCTYELWS